MVAYIKAHIIEPYESPPPLTTSATATMEQLQFAEDVFRLGIAPPMAVTVVSFGFQRISTEPILTHAVQVHLFLYGLHVLLFRDALEVLRRRRRQKTRGNRLLLVSLITLFTLSSISVPAGIATDFLAVRKAYYHAIAGIAFNHPGTERALTVLT